MAMATAVEESVDVRSGGCNQPPNPEPQPQSDEDEDFVDEEDDDHEEDVEDEDPFVDIYGRHEMTNKEFRIYSRQVRRGGGFDVDIFPNSIMLGGIQPVDLKYRHKNLKEYMDMAIEDYNKKQNANLEFVHIVKAN